MSKVSRGRAALAGAFALSVSPGLVAVPARIQIQPSGPASITDPRQAQPHSCGDEGDDAWWSHASTPGTN